MAEKGAVVRGGVEFGRGFGGGHGRSGWFRLQRVRQSGDGVKTAGLCWPCVPAALGTNGEGRRPISFNVTPDLVRGPANLLTQG